MDKVVSKAAAGGGGRGIKEVNKAKGKAKFYGVAQSSHKGARHRLDNLQIQGISMIDDMKLNRMVLMNNIRLIRIV